MRETANILILTGAGVSAESGVATFRGPDGLWEGHRVEDVATPEGFRRDPALVQAFYDARRAKLGTVRRHENVMWSFAPHDISVAQYLLGDSPISVSAVGVT